MSTHEPSTCPDVNCRPCLEFSRRESVVRLELAILAIETAPEGAEGMWLDLPMTVDALDVRNVLDLVRGA